MKGEGEEYSNKGRVRILSIISFIRVQLLWIQKGKRESERQGKWSARGWRPWWLTSMSANVHDWCPPKNLQICSKAFSRTHHSWSEAAVPRGEESRPQTCGPPQLLQTPAHTEANEAHCLSWCPGYGPNLWQSSTSTVVILRFFGMCAQQIHQCLRDLHRNRLTA